MSANSGKPSTGRSIRFLSFAYTRQDDYRQQNNINAYRTGLTVENLTNPTTKSMFELSEGSDLVS